MINLKVLEEEIKADTRLHPSKDEHFCRINPEHALTLIQELRKLAEALKHAEQLELAVYGAYDKCHEALASLKKAVKL